MQEIFRLHAEEQVNHCVNPSWMEHHLLQPAYAANSTAAKDK